MKTTIVDIHTHLSFDAFDRDRDAIITRFTDLGIAVIGVGVDLETSKKELEIAKAYENIFACIGLHPIDNPEESFDVSAFEELVRDPKVVAIGECGLDYSKIKDDKIVEKRRQKEVFEAQIEFAVKHGKPLMIHARDTHDDIIEILKSKKQSYGDRLRGNIHFFTGTKEVAARYIDLDFTLSFSGVITFVAAYEDLVSFVPLTMMHAETDAPFAAPAPYRGKRNESSYVIEVVKKIAEVKKIPIEEVQNALRSNAERLFGI